MAIWLHGFISSGKRYIQVGTQIHHITGVFRKIMRSSPRMRFYTLENVKNAYFKCKEDATITFYQGGIKNEANPGIWTYVVYECPESEEKVFHDLSIDTSTNLLKKLLAGKKLIRLAENIHDYLNYKYNQCEYLDVELPLNWNTSGGREIADLLLVEFNALKASSVFAENAGKKYMQTVLDSFVKAAQEVLEIGGTAKDFEAKQYKILNQIRIDEIVNRIIDYNDYRIWQEALPSKSKAVEYAFNTALSFIYRIK
ncbi:hypothetical protein OGM63_02135 [Plectonema radiosum NIES-515]|uniref:Uncharacterized protein n=1 Tax=Plectonema radiosum NIES-515 TaxID=2986073 RepID=A0ABT3AT85_9CYAN|nr:hypothetical protein [Plectonema radiosum]MCV3212339.1 hypothetical protein [Plectonema radiosum NIES-515]